MDSDDIEVSEGEDDTYGVEEDENDESYRNTKKGKEGEDVEGPSGDEDDDVSLGGEEEEEDDRPVSRLTVTSLRARWSRRTHVLMTNIFS